jgi:hypothetical protein
MESGPFVDVTNASPTPAPAVKRMQWGAKREGVILKHALQQVVFEEGECTSKISKRIVKATSVARESSAWKTHYRRRVLSEDQWARVIPICKERRMNEHFLSRAKLVPKSSKVFDELNVAPLPEGCKESNVTEFFKEQEAVADARRIGEEAERTKQKINAKAKSSIQQARSKFEDIMDEHDAAMFVAYGADVMGTSVNNLTNLERDLNLVDGGEYHDDKVSLLRSISSARKEICLMAVNEPWAARWLPGSSVLRACNATEPLLERRNQHTRGVHPAYAGRACIRVHTVLNA